MENIILKDLSLVLAIVVLRNVVLLNNVLIESAINALSLQKVKLASKIFANGATLQTQLQTKVHVREKCNQLAIRE